MIFKIFRILFACLLFLKSSNIFGQDTTAHIDPSKPTNLYNRLSNNIEYNFLRNGNRTFGYRANFVWASPGKHHSAQVELPLLYATSSKKWGLSDIRIRYYWIPYRNYSRKPGAFGLVFDGYMPTGNYEDGLGRGRLIAAPGLYTAFIFSKISIFPIISYLYNGVIMDNKISENNKKSFNGYIVQSVLVYRFNKKSYLDCTPGFMKNSYTNNGRNDVVLEGNYLYMVKKNKIQIGCFARRYFYGRNTTLRASIRIYF
ncbi:MAG TPA: hypothetical protein VK588_05520 [Chitinophagaceae bacterium]|nr:hypothetical protein [Chitinophagaceae bacterium]